MISPDILSVTHTNFAEPTYRRNKTDMLVAYQKAYEGSWRMEDLEIIDVMQRPNYENIKWRYVFTSPNKQTGGRHRLHFDVVSEFNKSTSLWVQSEYKQYVPLDMSDPKYKLIVHKIRTPTLSSSPQNVNDNAVQQQ